jgi:RNA polymerase sigma factor (sigma-70 family)
MKKINYFDEISGKEIVVEVSDEVAAELQVMTREENRVMKEIKRNEVSVDAFCNVESYLIDEFDILDSLIKKEGKYEKQQKRKELLNKALYLLSDKEKEVINGVFGKNLTQVELSRLLEITRSAVRQRYNSAMCKIKEFIINNE